MTVERIFFFLGKGGVGKSTVSALSGVRLAGQGRKVLLVSLDPAHNLADIFMKKLGEKPKKVMENLHVMEVDEKRAVTDYLKELESDITRAYSYQTAFNLQKHFRVIRYSPGIEEYSLLRAFSGVLANRGNFNILIVDMPPTALTMKFFRLPSISLIWLNKLEELRRTIVEKKELVTKIKFGKREFQRDRILNRIRESRKYHQGLKELFENRERARLNLVINPDPLSRSESGRIAAELRDMGIEPAGVIVNRFLENCSLEEISRDNYNTGLHSLACAAGPLVGLDALTAFAGENSEHFKFLYD